MEWIMGRDQYGQTYHDLGKHPRKALMERFGVRSAKTMFCDTKNGGTHHVGYIVSGHWITLYRVSEWHGRQA